MAKAVAPKSSFAFQCLRDATVSDEPRGERNEFTFYDHSYRIGCPSGGHWEEVFNSDVFENFTNPSAQGNSGGVVADGPAWDGMPCSAGITLKANGFLVFAHDFGDF
jgi:1,4-alpha-glucan branching enzyme